MPQTVISCLARNAPCACSSDAKMASDVISPPDRSSSRARRISSKVPGENGKGEAIDMLSRQGNAEVTHPRDYPKRIAQMWRTRVRMGVVVLVCSLVSLTALGQPPNGPAAPPTPQQSSAPFTTDAPKDDSSRPVQGTSLQEL